MTIEEIYSYYNKVFADKTSRYSRMMKEMVKIISLDENSRVLDYGCGTGLVSHYLWETYKCKIDAVDIAEDVLSDASKAWKEDKINWISLNEFSFPEKKYDLIISSQVIEHIHNVGNYLKQINRMLVDNGKLLIGTPNVITPGLTWRQLRLNERRLVSWSKDMLNTYDKGMDHINAWDSYHFTTLLASLGFELEHFWPLEGVPIPKFRLLNILPNMRKRGGIYADRMNRRLLKNLCYTQYFVFRKDKYIDIHNSD